MMQKVPDWLNGYLDALLGERSTASASRQAETEEQARLMKVSRLVKRHAATGEPEPDPEFVTNLESQMRRVLAGSSPRAPLVPFWRLAWFRPLAGVTAAAAVFFLAFLLLRGPLSIVSPGTAPVAVMREEAKAPAAASSPAPAASGPSASSADKAAGGQVSPLAPPAAAPGLSAATLAEVVSRAQTIVMVRVLGAPTAPVGPSGESPALGGIQVSVERYLKGPLPNRQLVLLVGSADAKAFLSARRLLVMGGSTDAFGRLRVLPDPQAAYALTPDGLAAPLIQASPPAPVGLTEAQWIGQIAAIV
ncbi:MAG: hypothetical protein Q8R28_09050 [Dehalococcoidia bacterium]|nr:hypothetical protein [Dehalococcoidia bacterium]